MPSTRKKSLLNTLGKKIIASARAKVDLTKKTKKRQVTT